MSQGNPKKGGTVLLSNSPFQPGGAPPGAPQGAPPPGAPPAGQDYGAPPQGGFGGAPGAPPGGGFAPPQGGFGGAPGAGGFTPPQGGFGGAPGAPPPGDFGGQAAPPGGGWGAAPMAPPPAGGFGAPAGMPGMPGAPAAAPGGAAPDYVQGEKTKLLNLDQNVAAALGYFIGLLHLLFLIMEPKEHRFVRFHSFQWLFCNILGIVLSVVVSVPAIIASVDRKLTELAYVSMALSLLFLPFGLMVLIAIFKAFQGKAWKIPVIGGIAEKMAMK